MKILTGRQLTTLFQDRKLNLDGIIYKVKTWKDGKLHKIGDGFYQMEDEVTVIGENNKEYKILASSSGGKNDLQFNSGIFYK